MTKLIPLTLLQPGQIAVVAHVTGPADPIHRLKELGLHDGVEVELVRGGTPCILRIRGHRLALRFEPDVTVLVRQKLPLGATA